jgi:hypothetical protein
MAVARERRVDRIRAIIEKRGARVRPLFLGVRFNSRPVGRRTICHTERPT